jgi:P-type Cu+ transporter
MWVIPYVTPKFLTSNYFFNGMPAYIFILLALSSVI